MKNREKYAIFIRQENHRHIHIRTFIIFFFKEEVERTKRGKTEWTNFLNLHISTSASNVTTVIIRCVCVCFFSLSLVSSRGTPENSFIISMHDWIFIFWKRQTKRNANPKKNIWKRPFLLFDGMENIWPEVEITLFWIKAKCKYFPHCLL